MNLSFICHKIGINEILKEREATIKIKPQLYLELVMHKIR